MGESVTRKFFLKPRLSRGKRLPLLPPSAIQSPDPVPSAKPIDLASSGRFLWLVKRDRSELPLIRKYRHRRYFRVLDGSHITGWHRGKREGQCRHRNRTKIGTVTRTHATGRSSGARIALRKMY